AYTDRQIQEIQAVLLTTGWLSGSMQSMATVTDQISMSFSLNVLGPSGWSPGVHIGLPNEQRPYHMSQLFDLIVAEMSTGKVTDAATEFTGVRVPLALDADGDRVEDAFDGFPDDPSRWADTDLDGIEDALDDDIDGDGLENVQEVSLGTFPYKADSDADGIDDPTELDAGTDPLDPRDL
ncbi:MAG: thrombospondin type 3 repeat-containing protein, partial [Pseudomonadota bacterium]